MTQVYPTANDSSSPDLVARIFLDLAMAPGMGRGGNERNVEKYAQTCPDYIYKSEQIVGRISITQHVW